MIVLGTESCAENCFDISNMGIGAIKSHMKSKQRNQIMKHKQSPFTQSIIVFFAGQTSLHLPPTNLVNKFYFLWLFLNNPVMCHQCWYHYQAHL